MGKKWYIGILSLFMAAILPLGAADLSHIIEEAKKQSSSIQLIELNKKKSDLAIAISEVEEDIGMEMTGAAAYTTQLKIPTIGGLNGKTGIIATPSVVITVPGDGETKITVGADQLMFSLEDSYWVASPTVSVEHTIYFGNTGQTLEDLTLAKQKLDLEYSYQQSIYNFENSIYGKIIEILGYEKSLRSTEREIRNQKTTMDNALKLKTTTKDSAAYRAMELALAKLESSYTATQQKLDMAKKQYQKLTGLEWEGVEAIRDADLSFTLRPTGDSLVVSAALAVEIAKENLALEEANDQRGLILSAGGSMDYMKLATETVEYGAKGGITYGSEEFSIGTSVDLGISNSGNVIPTVTVSGSWKNNPTRASDVLNVQTLRSDVTIANIDYQEALLDYQIAANQLEADILSHQLDAEQLAQTLSYNEQVLKQEQDAFSRGLATQTEVEEAALAVELGAYDTKILMLNALILENRAKALQL